MSQLLKAKDLTVYKAPAAVEAGAVPEAQTEAALDSGPESDQRLIRLY